MDIFFGIDSAWIIVFAFVISVLAGVIKGVVGFGLPMVLVSGLGSVASAEVAIAGMILPTLATNGWQALRQGLAAAWESIKTFKIFLISGCLVLIAASQLVSVIPSRLLLLVIGLLVTVFVSLQIAGLRLRLPARPGRNTQAAIGGAAGLMGGLSGIWGPPTVAMLTALEIEKREQTRIQGVIYSLGSVALVAGHLGSGVLRAETAPLSLALVVPAILGMSVGFQIQDRIDQKTFGKVTLVVLLIGGLNLIRRGWMG